MAKAKGMTLKEAAEYLSETEYAFTVHALKRAAAKGALKAKLTDGPLPYYLVNQDDLIAWASDPNQHKAGRPIKAKD
jgi:hypothetical protein